MNTNQLEIKLDKLSEQYESSNNSAILDDIEQVFKEYLKDNPQDNNILIKFAIFLSEGPIGDYPQAIALLKNLLKIDPGEIKALLVLSEIQYFNIRIDTETFKMLSTTKTDDLALMSMVEYMMAQYFFLNDKKKYEEHLINSVNLYPCHVKNHQKLAKIYINRGNINEGCILLKKALRNITCVWPEAYVYFPYGLFKITTVDKYITEFITGTYISNSNLKQLGEYYKSVSTLNSDPK